VCHRRGLVWKLPLTLWDDLIDVGLRSHYVATERAAPAAPNR
jgi:hypothetical protein